MTREEAINVLEQLMGIQIGHFTDAEMLTALDMAVDALRWKPNWISVEDELPKVGKPVLFIHPSESEPMQGHIQRNKHWWSEKYRCHFEAVTHWMNLPQPPKIE